MNEPFEWHDLCRKHCDSFDEAFELVKSPGMSLMFDTAEHVLRRKLDEGYELVEPVKVHHLSIQEYDGPCTFVGPWMIELQMTARIRKL